MTNKKILVVVCSVLIALSLASCTTLGMLGSALETKYTPYVLKESEDIYGKHVTEAILVDKQVEGLGGSDFGTRILKKTLDGELEGYFIQFREQDNMTNDGYYYMTISPLIKVDGKVYSFPLGKLPEYMSAGDVFFKEVEVAIPPECLEALKTANEVYVQFYSVNDKDKLIQIGPEGLAAIKDFVK